MPNVLLTDWFARIRGSDPASNFVPENHISTELYLRWMVVVIKLYLHWMIVYQFDCL